MLGAAALLIFLSIALVGYALASVMGARITAREALQSRLNTLTGRGRDVAATRLFKDQRLSSIPLLHALLARLSFTSDLVRMIQQAGLSNRVGEVLLYVPLLALLALLLGRVVSGNLLVSLAMAAIAGAIPILVVQRKRNKRMRLFSEQLPDALDLIRAALQAGHSLLTALYVVADEFPNPVAEEVRTTAEEMRLGLPLRDALYHLRERVDDQNVPILIVGILVAQEVGGNLAEVLDNTSYTIRERFKLLRDVQVMTAQGRLSGKVLTALPVLVGVFMYFLNPGYFAPMLKSQTGWYMMGYVIVSIALGHIAIQRIVSIRV
jgi:tight adherence protein B